MKVLFICTGNTCRSSMAEAMMRYHIARRGLAHTIEVMSAGTCAIPGAPASPLAIEVMTERGYAIQGHQATALELLLLEQVDVVLTMTMGHYAHVLSMFPAMKDKVHTLAAFIGMGEDVMDPFGGDKRTYEACADMLEEMVIFALDKLCTS